MTSGPFQELLEMVPSPGTASCLRMDDAAFSRSPIPVITFALASFSPSTSVHAVLFSTVSAPWYFLMLSLPLPLTVWSPVSQRQELDFPFCALVVLCLQTFFDIKGELWEEKSGQGPELINLETFQSLFLTSLIDLCITIRLRRTGGHLFSS